jgi:EAL domain-containing protein (putative c-di-GMP-specific phosphodiesterase class I)/ActR/RegA family two-component response regulator
MIVPFRQDVAAALRLRWMQPSMSSQLEAVQSSQQRVLLVEDDDFVADALGIALASKGRHVTVCSDAVCATVLLEQEHFDSVISDLHLRGSFSFDGLAVASRSKAVNPDTNVVMVTGYASDEAVQAARSYGAHVLAKPFEIGALEAHVPATGNTQIGRVLRMPSLEETISGHLAAPQFQPIVRFEPRGVSLFATEALTRIDDRLPLRTPEALFRYAAGRDAVSNLDIECLRRILDRARFVDASTLFINVHPRSLVDSSFAPRLLALVRQAEVNPGSLVVEITEQEALPQCASVARTLATLRAQGIRFALDDIGIAHSHLELIDCIRPSFMKISFDIGQSNRAATRRTLIRNLTVMAHELGCEVVAERIETEEEESVAREMGIELAQGYRFGRPAEASRVLAALAN